MPVTQPKEISPSKCSWKRLREECQGGQSTVYYAVQRPELILKKAREGETLSDEVEIMESLDSPHIAKPLRISEDRSSFVMRFHGTDLFNVVDSHREGKMEEPAASAITKQVVTAIEALRVNNVAHGDVKPENVVVYDHKRVVLIDFGESIITGNLGTRKRKRASAMTPLYAAPELWRCGPSHKTDMWGVGIIAYIILAGYPPFHEESAPEYELNFPRNMTRDAQDFVAQCLCVDPSDRMRSDSALKHPFVAGGGE